MTTNYFAHDLAAALRRSDYELAVQDVPWFQTGSDFSAWTTACRQGRYTPPAGVCDELGPLFGTLISAVVMTIIQRGGFSGNATALAAATGMSPAYARSAFQMARSDLAALGYEIEDTQARGITWTVRPAAGNDETPRQKGEGPSRPDNHRRQRG